MRTSRLATSELGAGAPLEVAYLISSGSLVKISRLDQVGAMEEGLFIDGVDLEWCFRAGACGLKVYVVPGAQLAHSLGDRRHAVWFFGRRAILQHSPTRLYYMQRNSFLMAKRSYVPCGWKLYSLRLALERVVAFGLLVPPRWINMRMLLLGLWHGIIGRAGPYPGV
jgi:rhamnosyltransferase